MYDFSMFISLFYWRNKLNLSRYISYHRYNTPELSYWTNIFIVFTVKILLLTRNNIFCFGYKLTIG
jgi:hypothetical protein